MVFRDRMEAGRKLAGELREYANRDDVVVLGLPRGGIPVAFEVAHILSAPLDVFLVRKLGVPGQEELAMGAIASGGVRVLNEGVIRGLAISDESIDAVAAREQRELERREKVYRGDHPPIAVEARQVILVDDGLATGASMRAAIQALRAKGPARIIVAVPVAPAETCEQLRQQVDRVICSLTPQPFFGVGAWYDDFRQIPDEEVRDLLEQARSTPGKLDQG